MIPRLSRSACSPPSNSDPSQIKVRIRFSSLHRNLEDTVRRYVVSALISEYNGVFSSIFTSRKDDERKDIRTNLEDCFATIHTRQNNHSKIKSEQELQLQVANLSCGGICLLFNNSEIPNPGDKIDISLPFLETFGKIQGKVLGLG